MMDNVPLFMRSLPSGDKTGADDTIALEALQALIHEGTPDGVYQFHLDRTLTRLVAAPIESLKRFRLCRGCFQLQGARKRIL
jgi:hypothetical protein